MTKTLSDKHWSDLVSKIKDLASSITGKQDKLVSGTNIKTINSNSLLGGGNIQIDAPDMVQEPGSSTTSVMSQEAVSKLIYKDTTNRKSIVIGEGASVGIDGYEAVTIGNSASVIASEGIAIGKNATTSRGYGIAFGSGASASQSYSIALGSRSTASARGEISVGGPNLGDNGYNLTSTRLITNVHDPVNAQDAATKNYVDSLVGDIESALKAINTTQGA